jgi:hypothetical protein
VAPVGDAPDDGQSLEVDKPSYQDYSEMASGRPAPLSKGPATIRLATGAISHRPSKKSYRHPQLRMVHVFPPVPWQARAGQIDASVERDVRDFGNHCGGETRECGNISRAAGHSGVSVAGVRQVQLQTRQKRENVGVRGSSKHIRS